MKITCKIYPHVTAMFAEPPNRPTNMISGWLWNTIGEGDEQQDVPRGKSISELMHTAKTRIFYFMDWSSY